MICVPPRHLKSHLGSVSFPAWCLGHDPSAQILCVSYAQDLADKLSRDCRRIVTSDWYQKLFRTRLSPQRQAVPEFETTAQGSRIATSVGGVLTGRGADIIVIDDPLKPEEALSQAQREAANEWYDHTLYSRLNDKLSGAIVLIMHRLHESLPWAGPEGRPRWPCAGAGGLGGGAAAGARRGGRGTSGRDRVRRAMLWPQNGRGVAAGARAARNARQLRRTIGEYGVSQGVGEESAGRVVGSFAVRAVCMPRKPGHPSASRA